MCLNMIIFASNKIDDCYIGIITTIKMCILTILFHIFRCLSNIDCERTRVLSSSKEAEKKRKQRLTMSNEKRLEENIKKKDRMREVRFNKTSEEKIAYNNQVKNNMRELRLNKTSEEKIAYNNQAKNDMREIRLNKTSEEKIAYNNKMKNQMKTSRSNMTSEIATQKRENESKERKRKRELMKIEHTKRQNHEEELADTTDSTNVLSAIDISCCIKQTKKYLQRTQDLSDPLKHKAIVCVICDRFIIGTETIHYLSTENIKIHKKRISVESYEKFYNTTLKPELRNQYLINDIALKELLLSPRSRKTRKGHSTCSCCFEAMSSKKKTQNHPPKFAIANGFVIGSFPTEIERNTDNGKKKKMKIDSSELTDLMKAMVAPIRPYGSIFSFTGGCQKCIRGNYQFFEMDQNRLGGVIHQLNKSGIGEHIYCVLCGRMTPDQKKIARQRSKVDTTLFIDIMNWNQDIKGSKTSKFHKNVHNHS